DDVAILQLAVLAFLGKSELIGLADLAAIDSLDYCPLTSRRGGETAGKTDHLLQFLVIFHLKDSWHIDASGKRNQPSHRRHVDNVAAEQLRVFGFVAVHNQVIQVKGTDDRPTAFQLYAPHRATLGRAAGGKQGIHQSAERADGEHSRPPDLSHHEDLNGPQLP